MFVCARMHLPALHERTFSPAGISVAVGLVLGWGCQWAWILIVKKSNVYLGDTKTIRCLFIHGMSLPVDSVDQHVRSLC